MLGLSVRAQAQHRCTLKAERGDYSPLFDTRRPNLEYCLQFWAALHGLTPQAHRSLSYSWHSLPNSAWVPSLSQSHTYTSGQFSSTLQHSSLVPLTVHFLLTLQFDPYSAMLVLTWLLTRVNRKLLWSQENILKTLFCFFKPEGTFPGNPIQWCLKQLEVHVHEIQGAVFTLHLAHPPQLSMSSNRASPMQSRLPSVWTSLISSSVLVSNRSSNASALLKVSPGLRHFPLRVLQVSPGLHTAHVSVAKFPQQHQCLRCKKRLKGLDLFSWKDGTSEGPLTALPYFNRWLQTR